LFDDQVDFSVKIGFCVVIVGHLQIFCLVFLFFSLIFLTLKLFYLIFLLEWDGLRRDVVLVRSSAINGTCLGVKSL